jgi:hypothetical protein
MSFSPAAASQQISCVQLPRPPSRIDHFHPPARGGRLGVNLLVGVVPALGEHDVSVGEPHLSGVGLAAEAPTRWHKFRPTTDQKVPQVPRRSCLPQVCRPARRRVDQAATCANPLMTCKAP